MLASLNRILKRCRGRSALVAAGAIAVAASGCLFPLSLRRAGREKPFESAHYGEKRGTVAFATRDIPGALAEDPPPIAFIDRTDLSTELHLRGYLPQPYGKDRLARPCKEAWIPGVGHFAHSEFVSMRVGDSPDEIVLYVDPLTVYADQIVEVDADFFSTSELSFPFSGSHPAYRFLVGVVPKLQPGRNLLHVTAGIQCMSDPRDGVAVSGTLTIDVTAATLEKIARDSGPALEQSAHTSLGAEIGRLREQLIQLVPEYEILLVEPLDRGWTVYKNAFDIPTHQTFYAVAVARDRASGTCVANQGKVISTFDGTGYTAPEIRLEDVWVPFPCANLDRRTPYTRPAWRVADR